MDDTTETPVGLVQLINEALENSEDRTVRKIATRAILQHLGEIAPGHTVEVRVPPYGAVQIVEGPRHRRGNPPNVVETDPVTFIALAGGKVRFDEAVQAGKVSASGNRADLSEFLPLIPPVG